MREGIEGNGERDNRENERIDKMCEKKMKLGFVSKRNCMKNRVVGVGIK